jgi:hypothetical protein
VDGETSTVVATHFTFPSVQARSHTGAEWSRGLGNSLGTMDGPGWTVESGELSSETWADFEAVLAWGAKAQVTTQQRGRVVNSLV